MSSLQPKKCVECTLFCNIICIKYIIKKDLLYYTKVQSHGILILNIACLFTVKRLRKQVFLEVCKASNMDRWYWYNWTSAKIRMFCRWGRGFCNNFQGRRYIYPIHPHQNGKKSQKSDSSHNL